MGTPCSDMLAATPLPFSRASWAAAQLRAGPPSAPTPTPLNQLPNDPANWPPPSTAHALDNHPSRTDPANWAPAGGAQRATQQACAGDPANWAPASGAQRVNPAGLRGLDPANWAPAGGAQRATQQVCAGDPANWAPASGAQRKTSLVTARAFNRVRAGGAESVPRGSRPTNEWRAGSRRAHRRARTSASARCPGGPD